MCFYPIQSEWDSEAGRVFQPVQAYPAGAVGHVQADYTEMIF